MNPCKVVDGVVIHVQIWKSTRRILIFRVGPFVYTLPYERMNLRRYQIWSLVRSPLISTVLILKSTPTQVSTKVYDIKIDTQPQHLIINREKHKGKMQLTDGTNIDFIECIFRPFQHDRRFTSSIHSNQD